MSGNEVPRATTVIPMNHGFMPIAADKPIAPWTRNWAPITDQRMPNTSHLRPARTTTFRPKIQPVKARPISRSSIRSWISAAGPVRWEIARFSTYGTKSAMSATPSYCVRLPSRSKVAATTVTIARKTASRSTISRVVLIGRTIALTPITKARVTTVDARALPSAMSGLPSSAAMPLTSNSGSAESVETNNAPTTNRLRPIRPAIRVALSVRNLAPWLSRTKPMAIAPNQRSSGSSILGRPFRRVSDERRRYQGSSDRAQRLTNRSGRTIYYRDARWPPYGLHSNRDDRRESGACVLRPLRSRQRTTLDARDSTHRLGQPGSIPPRHVMAGDPQGWKSHHAVDDQRLELPTAVGARPPRGGEGDEGRFEFPPHAEICRDRGHV